jgi:hypothetical protein
MQVPVKSWEPDGRGEKGNEKGLDAFVPAGPPDTAKESGEDEGKHAEVQHKRRTLRKNRCAVNLFSSVF